MTKPGSFSQKTVAASLAKARERFSANQGDLFSDADRGAEPRQYVDLDIAAELLGAVKRSLRLARERGLSVEHVVCEMNRLLPPHRHVTSRQVYAWCAESREQHRFPCEFLPAFIAATGCHAALVVLADAVGFALVDERELSMTRLGENIIQRSRLAREEKDLKKRLGQ